MLNILDTFPEMLLMSLVIAALISAFTMPLDNLLNKKTKLSFTACYWISFAAKIVLWVALLLVPAAQITTTMRICIAMWACVHLALSLLMHATIVILFFVFKNENTCNPGDEVTIKGIRGTVTKCFLWVTLKTPEGKTKIIPLEYTARKDFTKHRKQNAP